MAVRFLFGARPKCVRALVAEAPYDILEQYVHNPGTDARRDPLQQAQPLLTSRWHHPPQHHHPNSLAPRRSLLVACIHI